MSQSDRKKFKHRTSKKKKKRLDPVDSVVDSGDPNQKNELPLENKRVSACNEFGIDAMRYCANEGSVEYEDATETSVCVVTEVPVVRSSFSTSVWGSVEWFNFRELRQKNGNSSYEDLVASVVGDDGDIGKGDGYAKASPSPMETQREETEMSVLTKSETVESVDWKRIMEEDPNYVFIVDMSPITYFLEEMYNDISFRSTTTLDNGT